MELRSDFIMIIYINTLDVLNLTRIFDLEQAIVALRKGAYILKYGRRGKPKLCPFRISTDERSLMWFSGKEEKQLQLSSVTNIIRGHGTRKLQPERECHSFSLIYIKNQAHCSLDLICKDKVQADSWFLGLKALISKCQDFRPSENGRGVQSCVNSPTSYIRRKYNMGLSKETTKMSQVRSVCGSPVASSSDRCFSDGLSLSSESFYSRSSLSSRQNLTDGVVTNSSCIKPEELKKKHKTLSRFVAPSSVDPKKTKLTDVLIWGEGVANEPLGGGLNGYRNETQFDALLPKVLDSVGMLDVEKICLAGKRAALVTKRGEVFCWGDGKTARLGDGISFPKEVESLAGVGVKSVSCSEYQTCVVTFSGELYTWGDNGSGQSIRWLPHLVSGGLNGINVSKVACGEWHTAIVSTFGQLFTFGDGTFGVLGHGNCQTLTEPKQVESLKGMPVKSVACGPWHTAAVVGTTTGPCKSSSAAGKLFTWGDGDNGRLGHGDHDTKLKPTCVVRLLDHDFVQVSCGRMLTVGLTSTGVVYTIGNSIHGQSGNQSVTLVEGKLKFEFVKEIASGSYHVAVLTSKGNVYTWGKGANGQLGVGDTKDRALPTLVESLRHRQVRAISCGSSSTAAICAHRSITSSFDVSVCRGCNIEFGFMKKKHNCYNCGLLFCSICSSKRTKNACLAPDETKSYRVCDSCFKCLERNRSNSGQPLKIEDLPPRPLMIKTFSEETDDHSTTVTSIWNKTRDRNQVGSGLGLGLGLDFDPGSSLMSRAPRWGQVSSPASFRKHCNEETSRNNLNFDSRISTPVKHKRAKDIIKALTSRLHLMSPRAFMRKQEKCPFDGPTTSATHLSSRSTRVPCDAKAGGTSDSCSSALVLSMNNSISSQSGDSEKRPSDEPIAKGKVSKQDIVKQKQEWMEEYQRGVYITFIMLPTGQKGIKRVRFSRKVFREKEAERWWEDNQQKVYDNYNVDAYINSY